MDNIDNNVGNNQIVLELIERHARRLEQGNQTFGREIPIDATYDLVEALEEALDASLYLATKIIQIRNKRWRVKRDTSTINHEPDQVLETLDIEQKARIGQAGCRGGECD